MPWQIWLDSGEMTHSIWSVLGSREEEDLLLEATLAEAVRQMKPGWSVA